MMLIGTSRISGSLIATFRAASIPSQRFADLAGHVAGSRRGRRTELAERAAVTTEGEPASHRRDSAG